MVTGGGVALGGGPEGAGVAGADGRVEVDDEREDVEREDEGDQPLEDNGGVGVAGEVAGYEGDGEQDLNDDEDELEVEGDAEDSVLSVAFGYDGIRLALGLFFLVKWSPWGR